MPTFPPAACSRAARFDAGTLALNVAVGRDTAGVHFRKDEIEGIVLGEATAISVLTDANATYHEPFEGFSLTTFDGEAVTLDVNPAP